MTEHPALPIAALPAGTTRALRLAGQDVLLCHTAAGVHAIENRCLHGGSALGGGRLEGTLLSCPAHGWRYDVTTGALRVAPEKRLKHYPVRIEDGIVLVRIDTE